MRLIERAIDMVEKSPLPDRLTLAGVDFLAGRTRRALAALPPDAEDSFVEDMRNFPIAAFADAANAQHYELPPRFFELILGPRRKYSCCLYPRATTTLAEAETLALRETVERADLHDGQSILELGCGWGSLTLYMAEAFPGSRIVAVSNAQAQRRFIERESRWRGLANVQVVTADMNDFSVQRQFDRIVSVEMFEHMSNWAALLARARNWLADDGRLFLHVFTHRAHSYRFNHRNPADWIARHFFTGGIMPGADLPRRFAQIFTVEEQWRWSGENYRRTSLDWLANFYRRDGEIDALMHQVYGADAALWKRRWRLFFLATAGLFGHAGGAEWGVGHYRLAPAEKAEA